MGNEDGVGPVKQWLLERVHDMGQDLHFLSKRMQNNVVGVDEDGQWEHHDKNHPVLLVSKMAGGLSGFFGGATLGSTVGPLGVIAGAIVGGGVGHKIAEDGAHICLNAFREGAAPRIENVSKALTNWSESKGAQTRSLRM
jgi:hypothetical protein